MEQNFDKKVWEFQNQARTEPTSLVPYLEAMLPKFEGKILKRPELGVDLMTEEGAAAVEEAIAALKAQKPLPALEW